LVAVGDLASNRKGMDVLIDALSLVPHLQCELRLIGGGQLLPELAARARTDPRITVLGPLSAAETRAEMASSDLYLFPTRFDVFGLSLVEAMGCGLASAVTSNAGAVEDLCVPDVNCLLVDCHEPEEWASAMEKLCSDADLRASLGRHAAESIAARWTMDHSVDAMLAGLRLGVRGA
jgi:glycosyltransferase involved in cell wall biosynthesis